MVCSNCHSHNIIAVQDQLFCINCGQMVPPPAGQTAKDALASPDSQPVAAAPAPSGSDAPRSSGPSPEAPKAKSARKKAARSHTPAAEQPAPPSDEPAHTDVPAPASTDAPAKTGFLGQFIKVSRKRIGKQPASEHDDNNKDTPEPEPVPDKPAATTEPTAPTAAQPGFESPAATPTENPGGKPRKQKPGRPRKRLDVPSPIAATVPLPAGPKLATAATSPASAATALRRMSDITTKPAEPESSPAHASEPAEDHEEPAPHSKTHGRRSHTGHNSHTVRSDAKPTQPEAAKAHAGHAKPAIHKVGLPPLHYASVLNFSLRARVRPHWLVLSALALAALLSAFIYGGWLLVTVPASALASRVLAAGPQMLAELLILAALYYVGRSISQTAIIYGIAREADARPVSLSRQLGIGINTFGRRLVLDLTFGIIDLTLLGLMLILFITGGSAWPISPELQVIAIFVAYLLLLYLLTGLAMARGLAGVTLTLTQKDTWPAISFGWQLFSHRFELVGLRFLALAMELLLALPLAALALAMIMTAPAGLHPEMALGIGLLAWLAGALLGAGTAAWWAALYRRLILADHRHHNDSTEAVALLSSRQPQEAQRRPLTLIAALSSFLLAAALALPWIKLPK